MRPSGTPPAAAGILLISLSITLAAAADPPAGWTPPSAEEIAAREKIRPEFESILAALRRPPEGPEAFDLAPRMVQRLVALGPGVAPFLEAELDLPDASTFHVAAMALGLLDTPGAADALRRADDVADRQGGRFGTERRAMALLGLADAGETDALDRATSGALDLLWYEYTPELPILDHLALLTYPGSVEVLTAMLGARRAPDAPDRTRLPRIVRALGSLCDARAIAAIAPLAADPDPKVRREAARALGRIGDAGVVETLLAMTRDADPPTARQAAWALQRIRPLDRAGAVAALLAVIDDVETRAWLYHAVAGTIGPQAVDVLRPYAGRADAIDRLHWIRAMSETGDRRVLPLARAGLADKDFSVAYESVRAIARLGGEGAVDSLLAIAGTHSWAMARAATDALIERQDVRVAPRIADRMFREILNAPVTNPALVIPLRQMLDALVDLRYVEPASRLRRAAEEQTDGAVAGLLRSTADRLDRTREFRDDPSRWGALLASQDSAMRTTAIRCLATLGTAPAIALLAERLPTASPEDRAEIVSALALRANPLSAELFERVLADPAFDGIDTTSERAAAAWGARRLGGPRMIQALETSAMRRDGLDMPVLVYWAQLAGSKALPGLERVRLKRLRIPSGHRGEEQEFVDEVVTDLRAGRSIAGTDLPPAELHRH